MYIRLQLFVLKQKQPFNLQDHQRQMGLFMKMIGRQAEQRYVDLAACSFARAILAFPKIAIFRLSGSKHFSFCGISTRKQIKVQCAIMFYEMVSRYFSCNPGAFVDVVACMLQYFQYNQDESMIFHNTSIHCFRTGKIDALVESGYETVQLDTENYYLDPDLIKQAITQVVVV